MNEKTMLLKTRKKVNALTNPYIYNAAGGLQNYRSAISKARASGRGNAANLVTNIACITHSYGDGCHVWSNEPTNPAVYCADDLTYGWIGLLQTAIAAKLGTPATGRGLIPVSMANYYKFWAFAGTGWATSYNAGISLYGQSWSGTSNGSQTATYTFYGIGVGIVYEARPVHSHLTYKIDAASAVDFDTYASVEAPTVLEVTGLSSGQHTLVITKAIGDSITVTLIGAYDIQSTTGIRLHRCSQYGATINQLVRTGATGQQQLSAQMALVDWCTPVLTIIACMINDYQSQTALASFTSDTQILISRAKNFGDVILMSDCPCGIAETIPMSAFNTIYQQLAASNNCCFVDVFNAMGGSYIVANNAGLMNDTVHPNASGHDFIEHLLERPLFTF